MNAFGVSGTCIWFD